MASIDILDRSQLRHSIFFKGCLVESHSLLSISTLYIIFLGEIITIKCPKVTEKKKGTRQSIPLCIRQKVQKLNGEGLKLTAIQACILTQIGSARRCLIGYLQPRPEAIILELQCTLIWRKF